MTDIHEIDAGPKQIDRTCMPHAVRMKTLKEAITLRHKPVIKIVQNGPEYGQRTMLVMGFWK
jgi:hypothetical protein